MAKVTIVRHINSLGCELAGIYCKTDAEIRRTVLDILDLLEDGDSITFEVVAE